MKCNCLEDLKTKQLSYTMTISHEPIGRKKQTKINILGSFCPFCGVSLKEEHHAAD